VDVSTLSALKKFIQLLYLNNQMAIIKPHDEDAVISTREYVERIIDNLLNLLEIKMELRK
jgi:hypothetical protein